jgi:acetyltransferase-like isoleucine patch superfamily enzyme
MGDSSNYFRHPNALVESTEIGCATRIWAFAHVMKNARIGEHCNVCDHVFVESNVRIGNHVTIKNGVALWDGVVLEDRVFVGPNAVFTNDKNPRVGYPKDPQNFGPTIVREGASIGANATIVCGVEIGRHAFVGAGSVVTRDVPDYAVVVGNPARQRGYMCECGAKIGPEITCTCGRIFALAEGRLICVSNVEIARAQRAAPAVDWRPHDPGQVAIS